MPNRLVFLLGGARSGKSTLAENLAKEQGESVLFVATAQAFDEDMQARIARHQTDRPQTWRTLESPLNVAITIDQALSEQHQPTLVLDCLTLLASNVLLQLPEEATQADYNQVILEEIDALLAIYQKWGGLWIVVSNEVGMGVVPPTRLGRLFRDGLGRANQRIAQHADEVQLLVAGIGWKLK
jgi:adenosylcobinamide kinase / adenosylcobinamide-phosphate guanylyltransferase